MPADNSIYIYNASGWWDETHFLNMLKTGLNPARFAYFQGVLKRRFMTSAGMSVLDVGCGGGILSEEFASLGCFVHGIDISFGSIRTAFVHSHIRNLEISYLVSSAQKLPFDDGSFNLVVCCDVLEHVTSPAETIVESSRVLKPGGLYLFDTINRTAQSYLKQILVAQILPQTRFFPPKTHDWQQFIRPAELKDLFKANGLVPIEMTGIRPGITDNETAAEIRRLKNGEINYAEFGRRLKFQTGGNLASSYIGYAVKEL